MHGVWTTTKIRSELCIITNRSHVCQCASIAVKLMHKDKFYPRTSHEVPEGGVDVYLYSFFDLGPIGVGSQRHAPVALPPGKTRYPLYRMLGGPQGRTGWVKKISPVSTWIRSPDRPARS